MHTLRNGSFAHSTSNCPSVSCSVKHDGTHTVQLKGKRVTFLNHRSARPKSLEYSLENVGWLYIHGVPGWCLVTCCSCSRWRSPRSSLRSIANTGSICDKSRRTKCFRLAHQIDIRVVGANVHCIRISYATLMAPSRGRDFVAINVLENNTLTLGTPMAET